MIAAGRTITIIGLTLPSGSVVTIVYGSTAGGGPGAKPRPAASAVWRFREQSSGTGNLSEVAASPVIHVLPPDGSGEVSTKTATVVNGATGRTIGFDYMAGAGGLHDGRLQVAIPAGWSPPTTDSTGAGYVTASRGQVAVDGRSVVISQLRLQGGDHVLFAYRKARAPSTAVGYQQWVFKEQSGANGTLRPLASLPSIQVLAPNGAGTVYGYDSTVANGAKGVHLQFTFQAGAGGMVNGAVSFKVPAGWSAPSTSPQDPGYVTASDGTVTVAGRTVQIAVPKVGSFSSFQITFGAGAGATAPATNVGAQRWLFKERSTPAGTLLPIESQPQVTVLSSDGSGRIFRVTGSAAAGSSGNT
ncbi:MAG TPA: hypothetical protein VGT98_06915, partial [Candidatus Elarobacter sp.]|nr:hypothetical protein [Candidatus Elarobacter sp.]